jgi:hypothetical protein
LRQTTISRSLACEQSTVRFGGGAGETIAFSFASAWSAVVSAPGAATCDAAAAIAKSMLDIAGPFAQCSARDTPGGLNPL